VRGVRRAPGVERIFLPGEREAMLALKRREQGLPIGKGTWSTLADVGAALGVPLPAVR
jgi:LDH2 family malate/lactate/ureidoglycolate dehydrogenase